MCGPGSLVALVMGGLMAQGPDPAPSPKGPNAVRENFDGQEYDRHLWEVGDLPPGGFINFEGDALHIVIPPGGKARHPAAFEGRFQLEGNFSVRARYRLEAWSPPPADWINLEIKVQGGDGYAAVIRTDHAMDGPAYVALSTPAAGVSNGLWKATTTVSRAGEIRLEREGRRLRFWARDAGGSDLLLGESEFGGKAIDAISFRVTVPATTSTVEARFDEIEVVADRIVAAPVPVATSGWALAGAGLATAGLAAAAAVGLRHLASARGTQAGAARRPTRPARGTIRVGLKGLAMSCAIIGALARADGFDNKSLWGDEVATSRRVSRPTLNSMLDSVKRSPFPPGYYLAVRGWISIWGPGDAPIRSLSVVVGLLAIPATYIVWTPMIGRRAGLWVVALLSLNAFHIFYSADAKMYSAVWLLATISSGSMLHLLLGSPGRRAWLATYAVSSACLPMVSYVGVAPLAAQALFVAVWATGRLLRRRGKDLTALAIAASMAAVPSAIWLPNAVRVILNRTGIDWIPDAGQTGALAGLYQLASAMLTGTVPPVRMPSPYPGSWLLAMTQASCVAIAAALAATGLVAALRGQRRGGPEVAYHPRPAALAFLAAWASTPTLGVLAFSYGIFSLWGVPRYLAGAMPAALLLVAAGLGSMRRRRLASVLGVTLLAVNLGVVWFDRNHATRYPWREVARAAAQATSPFDLLPPGEARGLIVAWPGEDSFDQACLRYALGTHGRPGTQVFFMPLEEAIKSGGPFLVLATSIGTSPGGGSPPELGPLAGGYATRLIFEATVLGQQYTPILDPASTEVLRLWECSRPCETPR